MSEAGTLRENYSNQLWSKSDRVEENSSPLTRQKCFKCDDGTWDKQDLHMQTSLIAVELKYPFGLSLVNHLIFDVLSNTPAVCDFTLCCCSTFTKVSSSLELLHFQPYAEYKLISRWNASWFHLGRCFDKKKKSFILYHICSPWVPHFAWVILQHHKDTVNNSGLV